MSKGRLYIISAPSGAGKSTLCSMLINKYPAVRYSISYTTRAPRGNEINGKEYFFIDKDTFIKEVEYFKKYDYLIINDASNEAFKQLERIYLAEKLRTNQYNNVNEFMSI